LRVSPKPLYFSVWTPPLPSCRPPTTGFSNPLFGDERHKDNTIALLKSFLDLPEEEFDVSFMDTVLKPESKEDKTGIVDVKIKTRACSHVERMFRRLKG
jgi:hypothetical protein